MINFIGYFVGLIVGVILGLLGSGGSLLVVPFLFIFNIPLNVATAYITILVGMTALASLIPRIKEKLVDWPTVAALGIPVSVGMLLVRLWLNPWMPDKLFAIGEMVITKRTFVLMIIATLLLLSFATMIGLIGKNIKSKKDLKRDNPKAYYLMLTFWGLLIGILPGFAGAGGGVLLVPLLVILFGIEMKTVVGTTLAIVAIKSFIGFVGGDMIQGGSKLDYMFLVGFAVVMFIGALIGTAISKRVDGKKLKTGFAWFLLALAIYILCNEFLLEPHSAVNIPVPKSN